MDGFEPMDAMLANARLLSTGNVMHMLALPAIGIAIPALVIKIYNILKKQK